MEENNINMPIKSYIKANYVEKKKIEEKIKEIENNIKKYREYVEQGIETDVEWVDNVADRQSLKILQELLEE